MLSLLRKVNSCSTLPSFPKGTTHPHVLLRVAVPPLGAAVSLRRTELVEVSNWGKGAG